MSNLSQQDWIYPHCYPCILRRLVYKTLAVQPVLVRPKSARNLPEIKQTCTTVFVLKQPTVSSLFDQKTVFFAVVLAVGQINFSVNH